MNRETFLAAIRDKISELPQSDIDRSLDYYGEMIDDYIEDGLTPEQAVAAMGTADEIAAQILTDVPPSKGKPAAERSARTWRVWEVLLLGLGSPIWVSLLLATAIVMLAVYIVIWAAVLVLYAADLSFAAGGIVGIVGGVVLALTGNLVQSLLFLGAGLVCAGLSILLFFTFNQVTVGIVRLSGWFIQRMRCCFVRKGNV